MPPRLRAILRPLTRPLRFRRPHPDFSALLGDGENVAEKPRTLLLSDATDKAGKAEAAVRPMPMV